MSEVIPPATTRIPVCGIGAAAGLDALQQFFRELPPDLGVAYIVTVHIEGAGAADLGAVLGRCTRMRVIRVGDEEHRLSADHVYVVGPQRKVEVDDATIATSPLDGDGRTAIDVFFRDLAFSHGDGFAVVLSGAGSDGAVGVKAVKERGGLVLVQDPDDAADGSMPRATVATGVADVVLPVGALARRFIELARAKRQLNPGVREPERAPAISDDENAALAQVLDVVRDQTGHDFSGYKRGTVLRRLSRRLQLTGCLTIRDYLAALHGDAAETRSLFDDLLISVTTFFRDPEAWESLRSHVVAPLVAQASADEPLRVWVPGCATGEEAYTVAILFLEEFERQQASPHLTIFASDSDAGALAIARNGLYPQAISTDVSAARLERYFRHDGEHYQVTSVLREHVVFAQHNVLRDPPFSRLHLLSCRNVLIYLGRDLQDGVMGTFRYACRTGGFLFLGASETAGSDLFEPIDAPHRIFRARRGVRGARPPLGELRVRQRGLVPHGGDEPRPARAVTPLERHLETLEEAAPPTALVDERWNVQHLSASAGRFLQQSAGPPAERITELVRPELRDALHTILLRAAGDREAHATPPLLAQFDATPRLVILVAQPRRSGGAGRTDLLVTFIDAGLPDGVVPTASVSDESGSLSRRLHAAEQRLDDVREDALSTNEELLTANEELQSLNEEYRSTTEELETSREELQSTNEELHAANEELKLKVQEVSRARSDVENLMRATNVATLFLNRDLRIKRFTTELAAIFSIRARDLDRPIGDLRHTLQYGSLEEDARRALEGEITIERQVSSEAGRVYIARVSPYRTADDHAVDGVVATFVDVTAIRTAEENISASRLETSEVRDLLRRLVTVQEEERRRIARDIHDQLGQSMTALRMQVEVLRRWTSVAPDVSTDVDRIDRLAQDLDSTIDFLTWELRPAALDRLGLPAALGNLVRSWSDRFDVPAEFHAQGSPDRPLSSEMSVNLYRILQEALHNVQKHAEATRVTVLFTVREGEAMMVVEDNGRGFEAGTPPSEAGRTGLGLVSMRERTLLIGGALDLETAPGRGTAIFVRVPLDVQSTALDAGEVRDGST